MRKGDEYLAEQVTLPTHNTQTHNHKDVLHSCYIFYGQGSIKKWQNSFSPIFVQNLRGT